MGKVIFWLVVFFVVLFALRLINVSKNRSRDREPRAERKPIAGTMTRCVDCGTYVPATDAKLGPRGAVCGDAQCTERARSQRQN
ncbi:MAG TPA: hypothetical protein VJX31_10135 [Casimicrobiaceae bacterium]|nr:hypothetical protein [Casimicrobiaceae bacterium]